MGEGQLLTEREALARHQGHSSATVQFSNGAVQQDAWIVGMGPGRPFALKGSIEPGARRHFR